MALIERTIQSEKLGRANHIKLWVPDSGRSAYPAVYLQHGLGDDELTPWNSSNLAEYAEAHELIIVTSYGADSWFVNNSAGRLLWEDFFAFELPDYIEKEFPAISKPFGRGQCGFSMGGYGAMMLTLLHPDRFSAVSTHSGSFIFGHEYRENRPERAVFMKAVAPPGGRYDLFLRAKAGPGFPAAAPAMRLDVGDKDHLLEQNRRFHTCLVNNGIVHEYHEYPGSHLWSYVDQHLQESLSFFTKQLRV